MAFNCLASWVCWGAQLLHWLCFCAIGWQIIPRRFWQVCKHITHISNLSPVTAQLGSLPVCRKGRKYLQGSREIIGV